MKKLLAFCLLILTLLTCLCGCANTTLSDTAIAPEDAGLIVHYIDIGQGDSTLLQSDGKFALIDGGEYNESTNLISYLSSQGVKELEFIISTHPHSDHCGGLAEVIRNFDTKTLICPKTESDTSAWEYTMDAADECGVRYTNPSAGDKFTVGSATITVFAPDTATVYEDLNDYSIVCKAEYEKTSFLFMGDATKEVETSLLESNFDLSADILKCGHHGSYTSNSKKFIEAVNPAAAIISCGKDNEYGHPHKETLNTLSKRNIPVYRTDLDGTIVVSSNGKNVYVSTAEVTTQAVETPVAPTENTEYIGNKNSKIFHESDCSSVGKMSEKNKIKFSNRQEAVDSGYTPCGSCEP